MGIERTAVYPGVFARVVQPFWTSEDCLCQGRVEFEGSEEALRRAGLLRAGDRVPKRPHGRSGFATMRRNGDLRVRWIDRNEASARDRAFVRFMEAATAAVDLSFDEPYWRGAPRRDADESDDDDDDDDDWPAT